MKQFFWLDKAFDAAGLLVLLLLACFYLTDRHISSFDAALACMGLLLLGSTVFHSVSFGNTWKCIKYLWPAGAVCVLTEMGMRRNAALVIRVQYALCFFQVAANCATVALFPRGLYLGADGERQFWLGNENVFIVMILAGLCTGYLDVLQRGRRMTWDYAVYYVLGLLSVLLVWSATSLIGLFVFTAALVGSFLFRWEWMFRLKTYLAVWAAGFFGITILRLQVLFEPIIVGVLHKTVTLTNRTLIWDRVLERIAQSPVWGYGVESAQQFSSYLGGNSHRVHAHNYILELLVKGGLLLLAAFAVLLLLTAARVDRLADRRIARVISVSLLAYFVIFIGDSFEMRTLFYMILALAFSCEALTEGREP